MMMPAENLILLIEDSDEDYFATRRALKKSGCEVRLKRMASAGEALDFLYTEAEDKISRDQAGQPALILLDLNLPGMDGRDLLVQLKRDERFRQIPVIILTTSENPRDISYCYRHGANGYHLKSVGFDKFSATIRQMVAYWFETAIIPASILS